MIKTRAKILRAFFLFPLKICLFAHFSPVFTTHHAFPTRPGDARVLVCVRSCACGESGINCDVKQTPGFWRWSPHQGRRFDFPPSE